MHISANLLSRTITITGMLPIDNMHLLKKKGSRDLHATTWPHEKKIKVLTLDFGFFQTLSIANLRPYKQKGKGLSAQYWRLPKHPAIYTFPASFQALLGMTPWRLGGAKPDIEKIWINHSNTRANCQELWTRRFTGASVYENKIVLHRSVQNISWTGDCPAWLNYYNLWWIILNNCILAAVQPPFATQKQLWDSGDMAFQGCIVKPYRKARIASITGVFLGKSLWEQRMTSWLPKTTSSMSLESTQMMPINP